MRPGGDREFLSCDWGTSHFRLKWIAEGRIIAQHHDENGCKKLLQTANVTNPASRAKLFEAQLQMAVEKWNATARRAPARPLPLLVSGMASSTIGWRELPYARAPIPLDGTQLRTELISWSSPPLIGETVLVSGAATDTNIMRGEETEAIGLLSFLPNIASRLILILPGTHSKHLRIESGMLEEIRTYMTGELYSVLTQQSVLAASVSHEGAFNAGGFYAGIDAARKHGLASGLFHTRTRQVLGQRPGDENAAFLSGLLIGAELIELGDDEATEILIGGTRHLRDLYGKALAHFGSKNWRAFSDAECESAVVRGHEIILSELAS